MSEAIEMQYNDFVSLVFQKRIAGETFTNLTFYNSTEVQFNVTEVSDSSFGVNASYYVVSCTKNEKAEFDSYHTKQKKVIPTGEVLKVKFVTKKNAAPDQDLSSFWVTFVVFAIFIGFFSTAIYIWANDRYENDPQNSLIFAGDGKN